MLEERHGGRPPRRQEDERARDRPRGVGAVRLHRHPPLQRHPGLHGVHEPARRRDRVQGSPGAQRDRPQADRDVRRQGREDPGRQFHGRLHDRERRDHLRRRDPSRPGCGESEPDRDPDRHRHRHQHRRADPGRRRLLRGDGEPGRPHLCDGGPGRDLHRRDDALRCRPDRIDRLRRSGAPRAQGLSGAAAVDRGTLAIVRGSTTVRCGRGTDRGRDPARDRRAEPRARHHPQGRSGVPPARRVSGQGERPEVDAFPLRLRPGSEHTAAPGGDPPVRGLHHAPRRAGHAGGAALGAARDHRRPLVRLAAGDCQRAGATGVRRGGAARGGAAAGGPTGADADTRAPADANARAPARTRALALACARASARADASARAEGDRGPGSTSRSPWATKAPAS